MEIVPQQIRIDVEIEPGALVITPSKAEGKFIIETGEAVSVAFQSSLEEQPQDPNIPNYAPPDEHICQECDIYITETKLWRDKLRQCPRCKLAYCSHFASKIDFQFCLYCLNDIVLEDSIITKEVISKSLNGKKEFRRVMKARHLVFKGQDWMFAQARISTLTDEELGTTIEYHRTIFSEMIDEMEQRKITKNKLSLAKKNKDFKVSLKIPTRSGFNTDGSVIGATSMTVTTTKVTRTKITGVQTSSLQVAMTAIKNVLKAQGLSADQIKAKLLAMAAGGK